MPRYVFAAVAILMIVAATGLQAAIVQPTFNWDASTDTTPGNGWQSDATGTDSTNWVASGNPTNAIASANTRPGISRSMVFDGTGDVFQSSTNNNDGFFNDRGETTTDTSWEIWFKPDVADLAGAQYVLFEAGGSGDGMSILLEDTSTLSNGTEVTLSFVVKDGGARQIATEVIVSPSTFFSDFVQLVGTYDKDNPGTTDTITLYLNGLEVDTKTDPALNDWAGGNQSGIGNAVNQVGGTSANLHFSHGCQ